MRALQTFFDGYRFRSRLEARWSVFFKTAGMLYEYEKQGYDLGDGIYYLPDFWLPYIGWVEVKGQEPTQQETMKAARLCLATHHDVCVFVGDPYESHLMQQWRFVDHEDPLPGLLHKLGFGDSLTLNKVCDVYDHLTTRLGGEVIIDSRNGNMAFEMAKASPSQWEYWEDWGAVTMGSARDWRTGRAVRPHWRILQAQQLARRARFEHGEQP